jgi:integrase/recombinase XerC
VKLDSTLEDFIGFLQREKRYSPHTLTGYRRDLRNLHDWLQQQKITQWNEVTHKQIRRFIAQRHALGIQGRSLQRQLSAIRAFYRYMQRTGKATTNPAEDIPTPKQAQRLPKSLDIESLERLLNIPGDEPLTLRDRAIMELLYSSGLRLAEIAALNLADLDLQGGLVDIKKGKGSKQRLVPVGTKAKEAIQAWLKARVLLLKQEESSVFISQRGSRLSHRAIQQRLTHWAKKQGLDQHVYPHRLRHAFASHLLESSGDIRAVQELLGHANISTTQVYTRLDFQHLAEVYDQAHPRARRKTMKD